MEHQTVGGLKISHRIVVIEGFENPGRCLPPESPSPGAKCLHISSMPQAAMEAAEESLGCSSPSVNSRSQ